MCVQICCSSLELRRQAIEKYREVLTGRLAGHVTVPVAGHVAAGSPLSDRATTVNICRQLSSVCRQMDVTCQHADER